MSEEKTAVEFTKERAKSILESSWLLVNTKSPKDPKRDDLLAQTFVDLMAELEKTADWCPNDDPPEHN